MALQNTYSYNSFFDFYYQKCFTFSFISFLVQDILSQNVIDLSTQCKNSVCTAQGAWNRNCCGFCHVAGRQRHRHRSVSSSTSCVLWFFSSVCPNHARIWGTSKTRRVSFLVLHRACLYALWCAHFSVALITHFLPLALQYTSLFWKFFKFYYQKSFTFSCSSYLCIVSCRCVCVQSSCEV